MSKWFLLVILIILLASIMIIRVRRSVLKEEERLNSGELKAEDFEIID